MKFRLNTTLSLPLLIMLFSCTEKQTNAGNKIEANYKIEYLDSNKHPKFVSRLNDLKNALIGYMKMSDPLYTEKDVDACVSILVEYLDELKKTNSKEEGMIVVKSVVLKLNRLNEKCSNQLIETDEREKIAEIIILAGNEKGYNAADDDITEKWRTW